MAIFVMEGGKFAETNKGALARAARDHGDAIAFTKHPHHEDVLLNSKFVGRLFESHEQAIAYLAMQLRLAGKKYTKGRMPARLAKSNPAGVSKENVQWDRIGNRGVVDRGGYYTTADGALILWSSGDATRAQQWLRQQAKGKTPKPAKKNPAQKKLTK